MKTTHRQKKKEQTRQALIESAYQLFIEKGYSGTTLADITERANCAPRTFFRYFGAKEDLLLVHIDKLWDDLAARLAAKPQDVTTLQELKTWAFEMIDECKDVESFLHVLDQDIADISTSVESRRELYSMERMRDVLIIGFAKDLHAESTDAMPQLLASAASAMFDMYHREASLSKADPYQAVTTTITLLEGAMAAAQK